MPSADLQQLPHNRVGRGGMMIVLARQLARREYEAFDYLRAKILADRLEHRAQMLSASMRVLTCESRLHHIEDVVSCGVTVARLCLDCDKQLDAPEWLTRA